VTAIDASDPRKRPIAVIAVGTLFVLAGLVGLTYHAMELVRPGPRDADVYLVLFVRVLAVLSGVFIFRGANWARWLAMAWMAYHAVLSAFDRSTSGTVVHLVMLGAISYLLLRHDASEYFRRMGKP
jgi:hypothetical protein